MIRVLIADDHQLVRAGLARTLGTLDNVTVVGEACSGEQALELTRELDPDVVLMDMRMPGMGGLEATRRILQAQPEVRVLAVTMCDDDPWPARMLEAGAAGYLTKGASVREVHHAVCKVAAGQRYISGNVAQHLALRSLEPEPESSPFARLSARELEIANMVVSCRKVQDISATLSLSPKTVNSYRYRIFSKLGVSSDMELALLAVRHGIINVEGGAQGPMRAGSRGTAGVHASA